LVTHSIEIRNQYKIVLIGRLTEIPVNIDGVCSVADFEVIDIVDNNQPLPTLMGLEWAFENQSIINLKRREMIFEVGELKVTAPLDPKEGRRYIEPTKGDEINNIYNMIARMDDYFIPTGNIGCMKSQHDYVHS
jgi:hypothetical protein